MHQNASLVRSIGMDVRENLKHIDVPSDLLPKVMARLTAEQRLRTMRQRFAAAVASFIVGLALVVPVWHGFQLELAESGFTQYLSLVFSDFAAVAGQWQSYSLTLLESLPIVSTTGLLALALACLVAFKFTFTYGRALVSSVQPSHLT